LNSKYFETVFESKEFTEEFLQYIKNNLMNDYREEIKKKIFNLA